MNKSILVTGANGHLGVNTIRALLKKGYKVTAFVRETSNLNGLNGLPLTYNMEMFVILIHLKKRQKDAK